MWFKKEPTYDWEKDFTETVQRVIDKESLSFDQATAAVRAADAPQLLSFDAQARRWRMPDFQQKNRDRSRAMLRGAWRNPDDADIYLFFESCSNNGYVREQAVRALRGYPGRLACAAALLRSEDWVDEVASTAQRLLEDLAQTDQAVQLFDLLDLVDALRQRQRFAPRWQSSIEPVLAHPRWRDARRKALQHRTAGVRLIAHKLLALADPELAHESLRRGVSDPSPKIAQFALDHVNSVDMDTRRVLLREGMNHALGSIRSASLRRYRQEKFDDVREVMLVALMDRNSTVRGAAAYCIEHEFGIAALPLWRAAFDSRRNPDAMIAALAEAGDESDAGRLRSQLHHKRGRIRAAALQGLLRLGVPDAQQLAIQALRDPSSGVARAIARACVREKDWLSDAALLEAFDTTNEARLRSRYVSFSALLPKWPRLEYLLALYHKTGPIERPLIDRQLEDWIGKANRSFAQPGDARRLSLARSIEELRGVHPTRLWDRLQPHLR